MYYSIETGFNRSEMYLQFIAIPVPTVHVSIVYKYIEIDMVIGIYIIHITHVPP